MRLNKRISRINRKEADRGSMVLEAALVLPLFIMFLFFFIYMVQMTLLGTRMNTAVGNAVKQVSAHIYPVALALQTNSGNGNGNDVSGGTNFSLSKLSLEAWAEEYASKLPAPLSQWVREAAAKGDEPLQDMKNSAVEAVLDPVVKPLLQSYLEEEGLNVERVHVAGIVVPDLRSGSNPYFGIEISYRLPIRIPFTNRSLVLQSKAEERLWIGETNELGQAGAGTGASEQEKATVLTKPDPAFAGRKATIQAKIAPGETATLSIYYKSGKSIAKYLGKATADAEGNVEWTWLVGGNTTPGLWQFTIETQAGGKTTDSFKVESPS